MTARKIIVDDYDPNWNTQFEQLCATIEPTVRDLVISLEHVGSTSVPGLAAKPIIDMDIVVKAENVGEAIERLATLGYKHIGDLGVTGREAFSNPPTAIAHHLYLCDVDGLGLRNHLVVRDYLRSNPAAVEEYGKLKKRLAIRFSSDIDSYIDGKTDFILSILRSVLSKDELSQIEKVNRQA